MKIKLEKTIIDENTYVPTLIMRVMLDAENMISLLQNNDRDEATSIIGEMFLSELGDLLDEQLVD